MAVRDQRPLSRRDGAISCLRGTDEVRNAPVRPGLASPTLPSELARRHSAAEEMGEGGGGSAFIPPGRWGFGARSLLGCAGSRRLSPELLAKHRDAGTLATRWAGSAADQDVRAGWVVGSRRVLIWDLWQGAE